jgi:predicted DsbA family dithiol-disulfide isomerase
MKRLIWWAEAKGQTIAGMWQNVVQARIEANDAQIQQMAEEIAEAKGLTVDEWKQRMLEKNNYEPNDGESIDDTGVN